MSRVFIGIGSNEGDRLANISRAVKALNAAPALHVVQLAFIMDTEPVGGPPQARYLNTAAELDTALTPFDLLRALKEIEHRLGRQPTQERWGPRPIDLDILLYEDRIIESPELTIPHPRMHERQFVLEPLAQLAPGFVHPLLHRTIADLLAHLPADQTHPISP